MNQELYERLKKVAERLKNDYQAEKVILFGSHAKREATWESDVDLLIIAPTRERFFERMATVRGLIRDLRNGLAIAPVVLTREEVEKRVKMGDQFVQEVLEQGIVL